MRRRRPSTAAGVRSLRRGPVLSPGYVRRELVPVVASVPTHVTLERVAKAVAAHVNGEHHVIQEEDATVVAPVHIHHLPVFVDHSDGVSWADGRGLEEFVGAGDLLQERHPIAGPGRDHVILLVDVVLAFLVVAVSVRGVVATVVGGEASFRRQALFWQVDVLLLQVLGGTVGHLGAGEGYGVHAADDWNHLRGGSRRCLHQGAQSFGTKIADGIIDGLVHHPGLDYLTLFLVHIAGIIADVKAVALLT